MAGLLLGIVVSSSIQDGWVCGYAMSVALTLLWSVKNGYPKQEFYVSRTTTLPASGLHSSEECQQSSCEQVEAGAGRRGGGRDRRNDGVV